jgi:sulfatase modifying factor 1
MRLISQIVVLAVVAMAACTRAPDQLAMQCAATIEIGSQIAIPAGHVARGAVAFEVEEGVGGQGEVRAISMDAHEVTNSQYAAFVAATRYVTVAERAGPVVQPMGSAVFDRGRRMLARRSNANWRHPDGASVSIEGRDAISGCRRRLRRRASVRALGGATFADGE